MDDALDEQHVFAWVEQFFKFDSRQDQEFFAPKEIVRDMLQHDEYLANTTKSQTGARAINNCIIDIIRDMLDQPPRHEISTQYAYGTDPNKPILLSYLGRVYDVSIAREVYGPGMSYRCGPAGCCG